MCLVISLHFLTLNGCNVQLTVTVSEWVNNFLAVNISQHFTGHSVPSIRWTTTKSDKAIVDYTTPMLCTPITHILAIGDAAYRQHAGGGPSHKHR